MTGLATLRHPPAQWTDAVLLPLELFDLPHPHVHSRAVRADEIDEYRHVNNTYYVRWLDEAAWSHSAELGLPVETCVVLDRGMAVVRTVIVYQRPALLGDEVVVANVAPAGFLAHARAPSVSGHPSGRSADARACRSRLCVH